MKLIHDLSMASVAMLLREAAKVLEKGSKDIVPGRRGAARILAHRLIQRAQDALRRA